ncbi:PH domain leucine-rich repeat-containing protein phosphatase 1 [Bagarius yarrelli]|uniref:PH domain leucine-rich repeat-containing protein phosphatase 1 n=1 Tax=Bagarius yarrelli TaxID=175774 RepID=A0A556V0Z4_BAGYA|nr:PH domain leucine-rich repeat-containing protein phosphatase 1 [Bagarius yarrelli]
MESATLAERNSWKSGLDKLKSPTAVSVALITGVGDGGGGVDDGGGRQTTAPPRIDVFNGNRCAQPAGGLNMSSKALVKTPKSGRGFTGNSNSLLLKRRRLKRNLSATAATTTTTTTTGKMNPVSVSVPGSAATLDRKTLLKRRQNAQLQPADRQWIRADLHRGSVHVHDKLAPTSPPRPVLCTLETTASEIALRLSQLGGKTASVVRIGARLHPTTDVNGNSRGRQDVVGDIGSEPSDRLRLLLLQTVPDAELFSPRSESDVLDNSRTPDDDEGDDECAGGLGRNSVSDDELSSKLGEHRDSLSDDMVLGTDASALSPAFDSATEGLDTYGSSSDELELEGPPSSTADSVLQELDNFTDDVTDRPEQMSLTSDSVSKLGDEPDHPGSPVSRSRVGSASAQDSRPALYVQLHGEAARRLAPDERPLQLQNDFLFKLGFKDPWRVQEEGMNTELGSLLRFYADIDHLREALAVYTHMYRHCGEGHLKETRSLGDVLTVRDQQLSVTLSSDEQET